MHVGDSWPQCGPRLHCLACSQWTRGLESCKFWEYSISSVPSLSRQAPLGSAQRRQSLFNIATDAKGKGLAGSAAGESRGLGAQRALPMACCVAGLLQSAAKEHLTTPPSTLPGEYHSLFDYLPTKNSSSMFRASQSWSSQLDAIVPIAPCTPLDWTEMG